jgi:hypothetical protein
VQGAVFKHTVVKEPGNKKPFFLHASSEVLMK